MALEIGTFDFERGETVRRRLSIVEVDGTTPKDLTGATILWNLIDASGAKLYTPDKTAGTGISFIGAPTEGVPMITLTAEETTELSAWGPYTQEWVITDALGDTQIYRGRIVVNEAVIPMAA